MGVPIKIITAEKLLRVNGFIPKINHSHHLKDNKEYSINIIGLRPGEKMFEKL